ncbi:hypothetical protein [Mycobacterium tuberculosis]|uniref:hypothetical protein n=1 Tax=Mycobacterium tuberculosis TaxID=1773 RepID=UPI0004F27C29|nr:hypothetical protein [Mycobacterium tuberculosis]OBJ47282.1 hypothetical protein A5629_20440 [Mycobacterium tuberculosis]QON32717.1 hypothetical protein FPJ84_00050 [Mycobacterium tuberculosis]REM28838.1 hypothetical protein DSI44_09480 [Mycobacterium tuberculosis]REO17632.1 hypothetical protein DSI89_08450 [Mycobacterium tuberculosis]REP04896.1 hypothetical protein DSJ05_08315 [Mycobacterium tuberculosis]
MITIASEEGVDGHSDGLDTRPVQVAVAVHGQPGGVVFEHVLKCLEFAPVWIANDAGCAELMQF